MRLRILSIATIVTAALLAISPAAAQDWPARTVRIIVPFAPGSTPDFVARLIAEGLQQKFHQSFVVENRTGAGGNLGTDMVAKANPDGYTLGVSIGGPLAINALLLANMPYDSPKDFAFITMLTTQPCALVVNAALQAENVAALVALLKQNPGQYNYGSVGVGSLSQLAMEAIAKESGTRLVHVPYAGAPQAVTALLRNDVQMACLPAISIVPHTASGKLKILAVSTRARSALLPDVPTLKESHIDVEADAWNGLIAPAKTPDAIIEAVRREVNEVLALPDARAKLAAQMMEPMLTSPAEFRARIEADRERWSPIIAAAKIKID